MTWNLCSSPCAARQRAESSLTFPPCPPNPKSTTSSSATSNSLYLSVPSTPTCSQELPLWKAPPTRSRRAPACMHRQLRAARASKRIASVLVATSALVAAASAAHLLQAQLQAQGGVDAAREASPGSDADSLSRGEACHTSGRAMHACCACMQRSTPRGLGAEPARRMHAAALEPSATRM
jgi:hypothetical protein